MSNKLKFELHKVIAEYLDYCNVVFDYNYSPARKLDLSPGELYYTRNNVSNVRRREEPTFMNFANWLAYTPLPAAPVEQPSEEK